MAEKKRRMTLVVPDRTALDITNLSKALGLQQQVVKQWVVKEAFADLDVKAVIQKEVGLQLGLLDSREPTAP